MEGSGYRVPPALVRRGDGQTLQLTPLLYVVLEAVDGHRTYDEVAERGQRSATAKPVPADNVAHPRRRAAAAAGTARRPDGSQPELKKSNPLLALRSKFAVTDPERTRG